MFSSWGDILYIPDDELATGELALLGACQQCQSSVCHSALNAEERPKSLLKTSSMTFSPPTSKRSAKSIDDGQAEWSKMQWAEFVEPEDIAMENGGGDGK